MARIAAVAWAGFSTVQFGDAPAYLLAARALVQTGHYPTTTDVFFFRPPAYPVFLAIATFGDPSRIALGKLANALLGALAVVVLTALSARIFRSRRLAIATGLLAAVHPSFLLICDDIQSEPLFLVFLLASAFLLLISVDRPSSSLALASGVALGLAALTRSTALVFGVFLIAPLADRRYPLRVRTHIAAAALLGFFLSLAPWTLRNYLVFHEWLPVNDAAGLSLYHGNSKWTRRFYDIRTRDEYFRWLEGLDRHNRLRMSELESRGPASPGERSRFFRDMAVAESRADPSGTIRMFGEKAWQWIRPYPTPWFWPRSIVVPVGIYYSALFLLSGIGFARPARPGVRAFALTALAVSMAVHVVFLVVWRYRIPYWDPVLLLYAVPGGARLLSR